MIYNKNTSDYIFGIRAVIEAIKAGKDIDKVLMKKDLSGELVLELQAVMREYGVLCQKVPVERLNRITRKNHQGVVAFLSPVTYAEIDNVVPEIFENGKVPFIIVLDGITDVRNFGAIARTCECAGVDAIIIPETNSVSVNADSVKTSAGALLHIPVVRVKSLRMAIRYLKNSGITVVGATEKGGSVYTTFDYTVPTAIIMGSEESGISNENLRECDNLAAIPLKGKIGSLNVSVAAGVLIYEVVRQRGL